GGRGEDAVEVRRDAQAEQLQVVGDVPDDRDVRRLDDAEQAAQEARAADAARQGDDVHAADSSRSDASTPRVCAPSRPRRRVRSSSVSTSSRFGASSRRDGASASKRSALAGPYSGSKITAAASASAFVVPSAAATS